MCNEWSRGREEWNLIKRKEKNTEPRNILITDKWRCRPIAVLHLKIQLGERYVDV